MQWKGRRESDNVEDRRGSTVSKSKVAVGGGLGVLVIAVIAMLFGQDPTKLLEGMSTQAAGPGGGTTHQEGELVQTAEEEELSRFIKVVLADTEDVWNRLFAESREEYQEPTLVLFRDVVNSACGTQDSNVGPFYCPGDSKVYIDLGFFDDLAKRHSAAGDFAQAYVVAHEVGHHIQNLLGTSRKVHEQKRGLSKEKANELSVRLELQADFYAGVWAHHAQRMKGILEKGDLKEALNAASQIGDDTLQRKARGRVAPESFTHGTAEQRRRWFELGFNTGDLSLRDTFSVRYEDL